jgi:hypothetical protein
MSIMEMGSAGVRTAPIDGARGQGVLAVLAHLVGVDDADPAEHDDHDGGLEGQAEAQGEVEQGLDVLGDAVLLDDALPGDDLDGLDLDALAVGVGHGEAELPDARVDPGVAGLRVDGVGFQDGEEGQDDAGGQGRDGRRAGALILPLKPMKKASTTGRMARYMKTTLTDDEDAGEGDEDVDEAALVGVEARRDEHPQLVEDPGGAEEDGDDKGDVDDGAEGLEGAGGLHGAGLAAGDEGAAGGGDEQAEDGLAEGEGEDEEWARRRGGRG